MTLALRVSTLTAVSVRVLTTTVVVILSVSVIGWMIRISVAAAWRCAVGIVVFRASEDVLHAFWNELTRKRGNKTWVLLLIMLPTLAAPIPILVSVLLRIACFAGLVISWTVGITSFGAFEDVLDAFRYELVRDRRNEARSMTIAVRVSALTTVPI